MWRDRSKRAKNLHFHPVYEENSNFYLFSRDSFLKNETRIGSKPLLFEVDKLEAMDIDEPANFMLAEIIYRYLNMDS